MGMTKPSGRTAGSYRQTLHVSCSLQAAFEAVADGIEHWWSDIVAGASAKGQTIAVVFGKTAKLLEIAERKEGERLIWECRDVLMPDPTSEYPDEWRGTQMIWAFAPDGEGASVTLTHEGLTPDLHCYDTCQSAWNFFFLDSLRAYLETGKGDPHINKA